MSRGSETILNKLTNPTTKIEWALRLLQDKGHRIGSKTEGEGAALKFQVDGEMKSVPEIYATVTKLPEWNDRLGLGTARIRKIKP